MHRTTTADRFIPFRSITANDKAYFYSQGALQGHEASQYAQLISQNLFGVGDPTSMPIFKFRNDSIRQTNISPGDICCKSYPPVNSVTALQIMDAPQVENDFYLNLLDWGQLDILAIALGGEVHLWNTKARTHLMLLSLGSKPVTALKWGAEIQSHQLSVGTDDGYVQVWDVKARKKISSIGNHVARVSSVSWRGNIISTGSMDNEIAHHDPRCSNSLISTRKGHDGEVCGLAWSLDGRMLASGGSDRKVSIWSSDIHRSTPMYTLDGHEAAVKALSWSPWSFNVLATGGGSKDKTIKRWRVTDHSCKLQNSDMTDSQVTGLAWSQPHVHESKQLLSSHGPVANTTKLWDVGKKLTLRSEYGGHSERILSMAVSSDGSSVATLSADETLQFWPGFQIKTRSKRSLDGFVEWLGAIIR